MGGIPKRMYRMDRYLGICLEDCLGQAGTTGVLDYELSRMLQRDRWALTVAEQEVSPENWQGQQAKTHD